MSQNTDVSDRVVSIRFADEYVPQIIDGEKTATVRYGWDEPHANVTLKMIDESGEPFARADIPILSVTNAGEALDAVEMMDATHSAGTTAQLLRNLNRHYEDEITTETEVLVLTFDVKEVLREPSPSEAWRRGREEAGRR